MQHVSRKFVKFVYPMMLGSFGIEEASSLVSGYRDECMKYACARFHKPEFQVDSKFDKKFSCTLNKHFATLRTVVANCVRELLLKTRDSASDPLLA